VAAPESQALFGGIHPKAQFQAPAGGLIFQRVIARLQKII
jgi:hypothetical protein